MPFSIVRSAIETLAKRKSKGAQGSGQQRVEEDMGTEEYEKKFPSKTVEKESPFGYAIRHKGVPSIVGQTMRAFRRK